MMDILITTIKYVAAGGGVFLIKAVFLFFIYVTIRHIITIRSAQKDKLRIKQAGKEFRASLFMIGILMASLFSIGIVVQLINHPPAPIDVIQNSYSLLEADHKIFGVYPGIWFHQDSNPLKSYFDSVSHIIIRSYGQLGILISLLFTLTLMFNPQLFMRVILVFLVSFFVSFPLWVAYPAVTPNETFYSNKIHVPIPENVDKELQKFNPSKTVSYGLDYMANQRNTGKDGYYGITTIPSMHITWSVFILYYGIVLFPLSAYYLIPYFLLNAFSTVYLLQHFTLDVVAGIAMGAVVIFFVQRLKFNTPMMVMLSNQAIRSDIEAMTKTGQKYLVRARTLLQRKNWPDFTVKILGFAEKKIENTDV